MSKSDTSRQPIDSLAIPLPACCRICDNSRPARLPGAGLPGKGRGARDWTAPNCATFRGDPLVIKHATLEEPLILRLATLLLALAPFPGFAAQFSIPGSGVTFDAPSGFTALGREEIAVKFPSNRAPGFVVGNTRRTTTIAFDLKPDALRPDQLAEAKAAFESFFERMIPGLVWKQRKFLEMQGQHWIYLEMSSRAVDTDIHNIMLVTPWRGRMLLFNFNSTREEFPRMEAALRKSLGTISLTPN